MNIKSIFKGGLFGSNLSDNKSNKLNKKESGFTIVEVMIVIGIGALIIVLVLVAAPALSRSSRNTQRRNDIGSIKGQLLIVTNNANNEYPSLTKFNSDVLAQIKPSIYKAGAAGNTVATPAHCTPASAGATSSDCADGTIGSPAAVGTWVAATTTGALQAKAGELKIAYLSALPIIKNYAFPGPDELHIFVGASCGSSELSGGNTKIGQANLYVDTDLTKTSQRHVAFVYQLEGQEKAQCEDNA